MPLERVALPVAVFINARQLQETFIWPIALRMGTYGVSISADVKGKGMANYGYVRVSTRGRGSCVRVAWRRPVHTRPVNRTCWPGTRSDPWCRAVFVSTLNMLQAAGLIASARIARANEKFTMLKYDGIPIAPLSTCSGQMSCAPDGSHSSNERSNTTYSGTVHGCKQYVGKPSSSP